MEVTRPKAAGCPRCHSNVIGVIATGQGHPQFFAICRHCFKYGETAATRDQAIHHWNSARRTAPAYTREPLLA